MILPGGVINISLMSLDSPWSEKEINCMVSALLRGKAKNKIFKNGTFGLYLTYSFISKYYEVVF